MHVELMRDPARVMPPIDRKVTSLKVWHCKYRSLAPIAELGRLQTLVIATYPDDSLAPLSALKQLRRLEILHLPKIHDLGPLAELEQLESLCLQITPGWDASRKMTVVDSLEPLARLPALEELSLLGVVSTDRSLRALERCPRLRSAWFSHFPKAEIARFFEMTTVSDPSRRRA